jgi:hypothetical protein
MTANHYVYLAEYLYTFFPPMFVLIAVVVTGPMCRCDRPNGCFTGREKALARVSSHGHTHVMHKFVVYPFFPVLALVIC